MEQQLQPHRGVLILVFGILGLCVCFLFGIAAWVMGNADMEAMDRGMMDPEGRGLTQAGKICGMVSVILNVIGFGLGILMFMFLVLAGG